MPSRESSRAIYSRSFPSGRRNPRIYVRYVEKLEFDARARNEKVQAELTISYIVLMSPGKS